MFIGCSKISVNVIVNHVQHAGTIWTSSMPGVYLLSFSVPGQTKKMPGLWFARGIITQADTMPNLIILSSLKSQYFLSERWQLTFNLILKKILAASLELLAFN